MANLLVSWMDSGGTSHSLDATPVLALLGQSGFFAPPYLPIEQLVPGIAGARLRAVNVDTREVLLPLLITGTSYSDLWTRLRTVVNWFDPTSPRGTSAALNANGNGRLITTAPDASVRFLKAACVDGLQLVQDGENSGGLWQLAVATLRAVNPFWLDANGTTSATQKSCTLNVQASATITTGGDVECWPTWTISYHRPVSGAADTVTILINNTTSGYSFTLSVPLGTNSGTHSVVVTTGPSPSITLDGANAFNTLNLLNVLFPLLPGANAMQYTISTGTITIDTITVDCSYQNQWNSP